MLLPRLGYAYITEKVQSSYRDRSLLPCASLREWCNPRLHSKYLPRTCRNTRSRGSDLVAFLRDSPKSFNPPTSLDTSPSHSHDVFRLHSCSKVRAPDAKAKDSTTQHPWIYYFVLRRMHMQHCWFSSNCVSCRCRNTCIRVVLKFKDMG